MTRFSRYPSIRKRRFLPLLLPLALAGCISSDFRNSVSEFGQLTSATASAQSDSLDVIIQDEKERIAQELASGRVDLVLDPASCLSPLLGGTPPCKVQRQDGKPLEAAAGFSHILRLGSALEDYAGNLVLLSSDASADKAAFRDALTDAASSVAGLDGAVRDAAKIEKDPGVAQKLGAVGQIAAAIGNAYFENRRANALKRIIIEADPVVQEAAGLLQTAYSMDRLYKQTGLLRALFDKQDNVRRLAANPGTSESAMRAAQTELFTMVAQFNEAAKGSDRFDAVAKAHADLAAAARKGASKGDLLNAAKSIFALAQTIGEELPKLKD